MKLNPAKVMPLVRQGYSAYRIAKELGVSPQAVYAYFKRNALKAVKKKTRKVR